MQIGRQASCCRRSTSVCMPEHAPHQESSGGDGVVILVVLLVVAGVAVVVDRALFLGTCVGTF